MATSRLARTTVDYSAAISAASIGTEFCYLSNIWQQLERSLLLFFQVPLRASQLVATALPPFHCNDWIVDLPCITKAA